MPPTLILIRHAEALHNVDHKYHLHDPKLSELGLKQCKLLQQHLRDNLPLADKVGLIVTSPMIRTLQTTVLGLSWLIDRRVPVVPRAEWQENSDSPCDTGSPLDVVSREYSFDFSSVDPLYPSKTGIYAYTQSKVVHRGVLAREWLKSRPEKVIAVVTHSAFLRTAVSNSRFANADYRIFDFKDNSQNVELVQWDLTETAGGGMGRSTKGWMTIEEGDFKDAEEELEARPS